MQEHPISMEYIFSALRILEVMVGIGLVIFVHELGHFLAAKAVGIRVERFSIGFPPRLFGFRRGETDYCIGMVPLGGYVKMAGEGPEEQLSAEDEGAFSSKTVGQRSLVITAGVVMNMIFAVIGFLLAFKIGVLMNVPVVGAALPGSAADGKLLRGDRIVEVNGHKPLDFIDVALTAAFAEGSLDMTVLRAGETQQISVTPRKDLGQQIQRIGISPIEDIAHIEPGSAAEKAGLAPGDRLLAVEPATDTAGERTDQSLTDIRDAIYNAPGQPLRLTVWRNGKRLQLDVTPSSEPMRGFGINVSSLPVVTGLVTDAPADNAGLQENDIVHEINGEPATIESILGRVKEIAASTAPQIKLEVDRGGNRKSIVITPASGTAGGPVIGAMFGAGLVSAVADDSPAQKIGLKPGALLLSLDGRRGSFVPETLDLQAGALSKDATVDLAWLAPDGEENEAALHSIETPGQFYGAIGVTDRIASFTYQAPGIVEPIRLGFQYTWVTMQQVFLTIRGMFTKKIDKATLGGPISIGHHAYAITEQGLGRLLYFLCVISVNLAVLNILPIPVLDGGHLTFLIAERIKGSPVSLNVQMRAQQVGLVLVLGLIVFVTYNDVLRLVTSP